MLGLLNDDTLLVHLDENNLFNRPLDPQELFEPLKCIYIHIKDVKGRLITEIDSDDFVDDIIEFQVQIPHIDDDELLDADEAEEWVPVRNNTIIFSIDADPVEIKLNKLDMFENLCIGLNAGPVILWSDLCKFPDLIIDGGYY